MATAKVVPLTTTAVLLSKLQQVRRSGDGWIARCPAHEDRNPSLSVTERDGKILYHCHAGCTQEAVHDALFSGNKVEPREVAHYDYCDESGNVLFQTVRYEPKNFRQRRPDGKGGWIWNLEGVRRVLYRLPVVLAVNELLILEGEKDCEAAKDFGLMATCNPMGAGKWQPEYSDCLRGKRVTVIADADEPGRKHAQQVASSLHGKATSVKVLELPNAKDLHEWATVRNGSREELLTIIERTPEWVKRAEIVEMPGKATITRLTCTLASEISVRELKWLWPDRIPLGKCTLFCGDPDVGKSLTVVDVVSRLTTGRDWPDAKNNTPPVTVAMLCAEDEWEDTVVPRLIAAGADLAKVLRVNPLEVDFNGKKAQRAIALNQDIEAIEELLRERPEIRVMTFDPLASYIGDANRNLEKEIRRILDEVKELASHTGVTVLVADHFNKNMVASAIHRVAGSTSVVGAPRAVWGFVNDPDNPDERMMVRVKCNVTKKRTGLRYTFGEVPVSFEPDAVPICFDPKRPERDYSVMTPRIVWKGQTDTTADEAFARIADPGDAKVTKAVRWLQGFLADGPKSAVDVYMAGEAEGFDAQFLKRTVRPRAGVEKPYQERQGSKSRWMWKRESEVIE